MSTPSALLKNLHDTPVDTNGSVAALKELYDYLVSVPPDAADGRTHWFCHKADTVTVEAATFLLRLFAYNSERVNEWKKKFEGCMNGCCHCIQGLQRVKYTSRNT